ncbi:MAG: hypothetical protein VYE15_02225, partial [Myxococcota bacterium]|nr:hypothetical protein [Myxococcota bacterium]
LGDEHVPLPDSQEQIAEGITRCQANTAAHIEVIAKPARDPERRVTHVVVDTDDEGRAAPPLLKSGLARFPYGKPFLQLTCATCEPSFVHISADALAEIIFQGKNQADVEGWLADHKGHPATDRMEKLLRELKSEQAKLRRVSPARQVKKVEEYLWDNRFHEAWEAGDLCIQAYPKHGGCKRALKEAEGWYLEHLLKSVRNSLKWGEPQRALYAAKQCLVVKPGHGVCKRLKRKAERSWVKARRGLSYRVQELVYRDGASRVVSEFKLKREHDYVRLGIAVYVKGRPVCVDTREVRQVRANEVIVHESLCPDEIEHIDRIVLRVEDTEDPRAASSDQPGRGPSSSGKSRERVQPIKDFEGLDPGGGVAPPEEEE